MTTAPMPAPETVAERAKVILESFLADPEFNAFAEAALAYDSAWTCFTGFPTISQWSLDDDKRPLLDEGLRALALKAAVYEQTGDEHLAEIPVSIPVDETMHAMIAQPQLLGRIADRVGITVIHQTDQEHHDYTSGDFTHQAYTLAWGEPPTRYWLDHVEVQRRLGILEEKYLAAGFRRSGKEHDFVFDLVGA